MNGLDRFIRNRRIVRAVRHIPTGSRVFDIGCHDGELFRVLGVTMPSGVGIDADLTREVHGATFRIGPGHFPDDAPTESATFDAVTALAVLEHVPADQRQPFADGVARLLKPGGVAVLTVPSPQVDVILDVFMKLKLLDGMEAEQHHGFNVGHVLPMFTQAGLTLERHERFQLGLNNLFVFVKPTS